MNRFYSSKHSVRGNDVHASDCRVAIIKYLNANGWPPPNGAKAIERHLDETAAHLKTVNIHFSLTEKMVFAFTNGFASADLSLRTRTQADFEIEFEVCRER